MLSSAVMADVPDVNHELERLKGFAEHQKENQEFNQERLSGLADLKKSKKDSDQDQEKAIREYKVWKAHDGRTADENSPEYREDLKAKIEERRESITDRENYAKQEEKFRQELDRKRPIRECQEYEVCEGQIPEAKTEAKLIPQKNRLLYGNKPDYLSAKLSMSGAGSGGGGPSGTINDYVPPAPPAGPEFYEPEIPPPPPPPIPEGGFDDQIPPPVFDEPGF